MNLYSLVQIAEKRNQDGRTWMRFFVAPVAAQVTACNEIASASLTLYEDGEPGRSVHLDTGHPGEHLPEGYQPEASSSSRDTAESDAMAFDSATALPDDARPSGEDDQWWSDWLEVEAPIDAVLELEYLDGSIREVDEFGMNQ
jgi:hypothetical protein